MTHIPAIDVNKAINNRAVNYNADEVGTHILYESVSAVVGNVRSNKRIMKNWSENINEDYKRRGKKNK